MKHLPGLTESDFSSQNPAGKAAPSLCLSKYSQNYLHVTKAQEALPGNKTAVFEQ